MALFDSKQKVIANYQKQIDDKVRAINSYHDQIGRLYYAQYTDMNVDVTKEINQRCDNITSLKQDIEDLEIKILYEKGLKRCPVCRTENHLEYDFCYKCGTKFDATATAAAVEVKTEAPVEAAVAEVAPVVSDEAVKAADEVVEAGDAVASEAISDGEAPAEA